MPDIEFGYKNMATLTMVVSNNGSGATDHRVVALRMEPINKDVTNVGPTNGTN
jgi:hypothetical protein